MTDPSWATHNVWHPVVYGLIRCCTVYTAEGAEDYPSVLPFTDFDDARELLAHPDVHGVLYLEDR